MEEVEGGEGDRGCACGGGGGFIKKSCMAEAELGGRKVRKLSEKSTVVAAAEGVVGGKLNMSDNMVPPLDGEA